MILEYGEIPYKDLSVQDYYGCTWQEAKASGKAPFGQLPLLVVDGSTVIAQTGAIARYAAGLVPGLMPEDPLERARADMIFECGAELMAMPTNVNPIVNIFRGEDFAAKKAEYLQVAPPKIKNLARLLGDGGRFFLGDSVRFCDFAVYHVLSNTRLLEPSLVEEHPNLLAFMAAVEALPRVAGYLEARPRCVDIGVAPRLDPPIAGLRARV